MNIKNPEMLVKSLIESHSESECVEFKVNNGDPKAIGKYVSALSNSAILAGEPKCYLVFGVEDKTHKLVGTTLRLADQTIGNESFLHWLNNRIKPPVQVSHHTAIIEDKHIELLCIDPPFERPVKFDDEAFIRIDSSLHPIGRHPAKEAALWQAVSRFSFEKSTARSQVTPVELEELIYMDELVSQLVAGRAEGNQVEYLLQEGLISKNMETGFDVRNLLVLLAAKNFDDWQGFERKGIRVIVYKDSTKLHSLYDFWGKRGYFTAFRMALDEIMKNVPYQEEMQGGIRQTIYDIPQIAIREILANAIIHQDLLDKDRGPTVEIHPDRIVITNPGRPLVKPERFIDTPSKSRNNAFSDIMRRLGVCEERGSGIDRAFIEIELAGSPPPLIKVVEDHTIVTIFGPRKFADLTKEERGRACYWHACLCVERNERMTNASLRQRFKLNTKQYPQVSEVIRETIDAGLIKPLQENQANRNARYVPFWF